MIVVARRPAVGRRARRRRSLRKESRMKTKTTLLGFLLAAALLALPAMAPAGQDGAQKLALHVQGMTCEKCAANVKQALSGVEGVKAVAVDLERGTAEVEAAPDRKSTR